MFHKAISLVICCLMFAGCYAAPQQVEIPRATVYVFHAVSCKNCPTPAYIKGMQQKYPHVNIEDVDVDSDNSEHKLLITQYNVTRVPEFVIITPLKTVWIAARLDKLERWLTAVEKTYANK